MEKWKRFYHQYIGENKSPLADMHEAIDARLREIGVKPHETLTLRSKRNRSGHYTYFDVFHDGKYIFSFDDSEKGFYTDEEEPSIQ